MAGRRGTGRASRTSPRARGPKTGAAVFDDAYGRYYDLLYRDKDYAAESEYVASHIRKHVPRAKRILELGCGTGGHAVLLAAMGFDVHGVDLSEAMLGRANARKASLPKAVAARLERGAAARRPLRRRDLALSRR
jgi:predicted TPR repeat methyltransferase